MTIRLHFRKNTKSAVTQQWEAQTDPGDIERAAALESGEVGEFVALAWAFRYAADLRLPNDEKATNLGEIGMLEYEWDCQEELKKKVSEDLLTRIVSAVLARVEGYNSGEVTLTKSQKQHGTMPASQAAAATMALASCCVLIAKIHPELATATGGGFRTFSSRVAAAYSSLAPKMKETLSGVPAPSTGQAAILKAAESSIPGLLEALGHKVEPIIRTSRKGLAP